ncbi:hypothetical protein SXCC_02539 [Gluconacetobacter sp. SXCC-1]|uniref:Uncharacterized protein n=1 Tax=Komagataeibacter rhaeticus TaxID=215221 RepID=A0A181CAI7_9PROT|nr:hypothetical protein [Komagataeibacter rhaeticus]ATU72921.1 hypothetical protein CT154_08775 [Komagataeibacter xylinus]EGG76788.1 hypothetical protein SXCC_02539 [Gluconacetobacter sp. SXCC-1]QIP35330.1 hypothetical protein GWK63_07505 [Komagataeibacter rhaeticus]QOC47895.1 hypothetical protein ICJ78_07565 [Komagataeibacter rhaeticus]WPP22725.1 hypothetical protein SCD25_04320 [Komagataeibacter rhaeticus]
MDPYEGWNTADLPYWLSTPQQDFAALAAAIVPHVESLLARDGVFAPFGATVALEPYIAGITLLDPPGRASSDVQLEQARAALGRVLAAAPHRAAAMVANCTVILPGQSDPAQAVVMMCAHRDGTAEHIVHPYTLTEGRVTFGPATTTEGTRDIFPPIRLRPYIRESCPPRPVGYTVGVFLAHGMDRAAVLRHFGLEETGMPDDDTRPAPASVASLPGGWTALWCNGAGLRHRVEARLATCPAGSTVMACMVDEPAYAAAATCWRDGVRIWDVSHNGQAGPHDLKVDGTPPPELETVRTAMEMEETQSGYPPGMIDFYFDIPVELVFALTGLRYCQRDYAHGPVVFDAVRDMARAGQAGPDTVPTVWGLSKTTH